MYHGFKVPWKNRGTSSFFYSSPPMKFTTGCHQILENPWFKRRSDKSIAQGTRPQLTLFRLIMFQRIYGKVRVWTMLHHKNVLRLFGTTSGFGSLPAFVTPWMERGSLTNYLSIEFSNLMDGDKFILVGPIAKWFKLIALTTTPCSLNRLRQPSSIVRAGSYFSHTAFDNSHSSRQKCHSWEPHWGKVVTLDVCLTS